MSGHPAYIDRYINRVLERLEDAWGDAARERVKECVYDCTGVMLAGATVLEQRHRCYLDAIPCEGRAVVCGTGRTADVRTAVLLNAMSAHILELDDGHRLGMLHPGAVVIPALVSLASIESMSPEAFLHGVYAGYDAMVRLACMVQPEHKKRGFHASGTCGAVGSAVAVGIARGYDEVQLRTAVSAALTTSSGLLEMIEGGSELKPFNVAQAAMGGMASADVALCGYAAPRDALGGMRGFIRAHNGHLDEERVEAALVMEDCVGTVYRKAYASCRHLHSPVEAALTLRERLSKDEKVRIHDIEVATYDLAVFGHDGIEVSCVSDAKMSIPYAVSVAFLRGCAGVDAFSDKMLADGEVRALMSHVRVYADDRLSALVPSKRAAMVTLLDGAGEAIASHRVDYPKGEPENPLTHAELGSKFVQMCTVADLSETHVHELSQVIWRLEDMELKRYLELVR